MKITVVGAGKVGSAIAFAALSNLDADEIILIDILKNLALGEALDLSHAAVGMCKKAKISGSDNYDLAAGSDFVVVTAGRPTQPGQVRSDLLAFNAPIVEEVCGKLQQASRNATAIIVTNPVAEMAEITKKYFPRVIPMDNQLDTSRVKLVIGNELNIPPQSVHSRVKGGHSEEMQVEFLDKLTEAQKKSVQEKVQNAAWEIRELKGATTSWGIAAHVAEEIKRNIIKP